MPLSCDAAPRGPTSTGPFGCRCHAPEVARATASLTRRALLGGFSAASAATALFGAAPRAGAAAPERPILFTNARVFDGQSPTLRDGLDVLVSGTRIEALPPAAETVADARTIDCGGRVLMPGLIDAHWHALLAGISMATALTADLPYVFLVAAEEAKRTLLRGFTTVRDVGGPAFALKRAIDEGIVPGPRIFPSGAMLSQTSGHGDFRPRRDVGRPGLQCANAVEMAGVAAIADGADEVLRKTREQLLLGASQIKIMVGGGVTSAYDPLDSVQFTPPEIRAAVAAAADWGTYVCAHVYTPPGIERAIDCGVKCIEHGQLADEAAVRRIVDTGTWWSLQPFLPDEDANPMQTPQQMADKGTVFAGTVRAYEMGKKFGARIGFGTDILLNPGGTGSQGRQLAKLARFFSDAEVLRMATGTNAELLALSGGRAPYDGALGVIAPGAFADLLVFDGDPTQTIGLIAEPERTLKLVMKDGRIHKDTLPG